METPVSISWNTLKGTQRSGLLVRVLDAETGALEVKASDGRIVVAASRLLPQSRADLEAAVARGEVRGA